MTQEKSYKETLNLPDTKFPMKADLSRREPEMLSVWEKEGLYRSIRQKAQGRKKYILHDGPPYANGHIHIGHALNKILKDMIVRYWGLRGMDALYVPGWDCHGLPIEHQCLKEMGKRKEEVERVAFRKQARAYAEKFISIQREEFKRLGIFGEWDKPYLTMNYGYQAAIAESFLKLCEKDYIEQRLKPVPWCFDCETALADAELEYEDKVSTSVYAAFKVDDSNPENLKFTQRINQKAGNAASDPVYVLIWTTTPWTLPANTGIAYHPDLTYRAAKTDQGTFVFAEDLAETLQKKFGWKEMKVLESFQGRNFPFGWARHPFLERASKMIEADYVSNADGTGFVHIAPGHGEEDYQYGHLDNALPILSPVDEKGRFTKDFHLMEGLHVFKSNEKIIELLKEKKALLHTEAHPHSYPHCWRCKKPILFRATKQWFMKIDHHDLRRKMSLAIQKEIRFTPEGGKNRIGSMVETRPEWCLSRQRYWGVPIPIISCKSCKKLLVKESKDMIVKAFEEKGADVWFEKKAEDFLGGVKPGCCASPELVKETDIIDVWFDSGVSHQAVLKKHKDLQPTADLYLEGSDQHRGWFQSSLTTSMALEGAPPFRGVLTHGFVMDGEGRKMSKSAGNVVSPQDVMKEFGADILRLWVSSCDYQFDVRVSKEILKQLADSYRKIRNTFRYILANLYDFDPKKDRMDFEKLNPLDQWAIAATDRLVLEIDHHYREFEFHEIYQKVHHFCSLHLSSYYFDALKDTLYTARKNGPLRRSAQNALFVVLGDLVKILAPILPFTADEVWRSFPIEEGVPSIHESHLDLEKKHARQMSPDWALIRQLRDVITPFLEMKRTAGVIGSSLDAKIYYRVDHPELAKILKENHSELPRVFIVSQLEWSESDREGMVESAFTLPGSSIAGKVWISVEKADGSKCVRCWNYSLVVGTHPEHPGLCGKCLDAVA
jgi:isoleucyl-tRNA synthetase